ncbi:hypothetical protein B7494_g1243 [Chlorociboria aeruginascens]|nr:hypothetical protein B7494_g1243 [Chlorociboria aeruginascens]
MATDIGGIWKLAQRLKKELESQLKKDLPLFDDIDHLIVELRKICIEALFLNFEYATQKGVEDHLWGAHSIINSRYRKIVSHYRTGDQKKHVVERRKLEKRYADFIKTSQHFYKGYIQRLASHFDGLEELRRIAHRLSLSTQSADNRVRVSAHLKHLIDLSCHFTLLRLGDLSRYRNQLRTKDRSWEPAMAFYSLANDLYPSSGSSHNQMAVIALADSNHLGALYHLYRAIAVDEPNPNAKGNLEIEFKKITTAWSQGQRNKTDSDSTLILWFVRLQAKFYKGLPFSEQEELENTVLSLLTRALKAQSFEATVEKFILINIAAEYVASERIREENTTEHTRSFFFFFGFNIRMLLTLLKLLQPEFEDRPYGEDLPNSTDTSQPAKPRDVITAVARRVLPAVRRYSVWLLLQAPIIVAYSSGDMVPSGSGDVMAHTRAMWKTFAEVLTRIPTYFAVPELPSLKYLLEEDETTVGFKPLQDVPGYNIYTLETDDKVLKQRSTDHGVQRCHPNEEMLARVRDILICAMHLQDNSGCPIVFSQSTFTYVEGGHPVADPIHSQQSDSSMASPPQSKDNSITTQSIKEATENNKVITRDVSFSQQSQQNMDTDTQMRDMVDNLLEASNNDETSYGMHSGTANEIFAPFTQNDVPSNLLLQSSSKALPSLPGLWSTPFTPRPNELKRTSPECPSSAHQYSPLQLATSEQRRAAAEALDKKCGLSKYNSWGATSGPASSSMSQPVNHVLQESLAQQFMPMSISSQFPDSSSLYGNTPNVNKRSGAGPSRVLYSAFHGNDSTIYPGATDFSRMAMLQSSIWTDSQKPPGWNRYSQTPPNGQGS